jgi:hypothetical protein
VQCSGGPRRRLRHAHAVRTPARRCPMARLAVPLGAGARPISPHHQASAFCPFRAGSGTEAAAPASGRCPTAASKRRPCVTLRPAAAGARRTERARGRAATSTRGSRSVPGAAWQARRQLPHPPCRRVCLPRCDAPGAPRFEKQPGRCFALSLLAASPASEVAARPCSGWGCMLGGAVLRRCSGAPRSPPPLCCAARLIGFEASSSRACMTARCSDAGLRAVCAAPVLALQAPHSRRDLEFRAHRPRIAPHRRRPRWQRRAPVASEAGLLTHAGSGRAPAAHAPPPWGASLRPWCVCTEFPSTRTCGCRLLERAADLRGRPRRMPPSRRIARPPRCCCRSACGRMPAAQVAPGLAHRTARACWVLLSRWHGDGTCITSTGTSAGSCCVGAQGPPRHAAPCPMGVRARARRGPPHHAASPPPCLLLLLASLLSLQRKMYPPLTPAGNRCPSADEAASTSSTRRCSAKRHPHGRRRRPSLPCSPASAAHRHAVRCFELAPLLQKISQSQRRRARASCVRHSPSRTPRLPPHARRAPRSRTPLGDRCPRRRPAERLLPARTLGVLGHEGRRARPRTRIPTAARRARCTRRGALQARRYRLVTWPCARRYACMGAGPTHRCAGARCAAVASVRLPASQHPCWPRLALPSAVLLAGNAVPWRCGILAAGRRRRRRPRSRGPDAQRDAPAPSAASRRRCIAHAFRRSTLAAHAPPRPASSPTPFVEAKTGGVGRC